VVSHNEEADVTMEPLPSEPEPLDISIGARAPILDPGATTGASSMRPSARIGLAVANAVTPSAEADAGATAVCRKELKLWISPGCPPLTCPACYRKKGGKLSVGTHSRGRDGLVCDMPGEDGRSKRAEEMRSKRAKKAADEVDGEAAVGDGAVAASASGGPAGAAMDA